MNVSKSILLVEDNMKLAQFLQKRLVAAGYVVSHETQGDKAVNRIVREQPDLVILDIMLPKMNGKQVCQSVRHNYNGSILMLTALDDIQTEVTSLDLGADTYLTKPVADDVLLAHVAALLRRQSRVDATQQVEFGVLQVDLASKSVRLSGNVVSLSPSEFELLALLAVNHDMTLSRDNIMQALRGHDYDGVDRSIDLRVSKLRKALEDDEKQPTRIKTVHGKGYVLVSSAFGMESFYET